MSDTYFGISGPINERGTWFVPNDPCRGPWDPDSCHAGPPTGLLARAMEHELGDRGSPQSLVRITVELIRPVPMAGFWVKAQTVRTGRSVTTLKASIVDADGQIRVTATGMALRTAPAHLFPSPSDQARDPSEAEPGPFPIKRSRHSQPGFATSTEIRYPQGESGDPGPTTVWMRTIPLLADETPSPFQQICPLADCGNAFGRNAEPTEVGFINPDLTIVLHRQPVGEWLGSTSRSFWQPNGIGLAEAALFDQQGTVGVALQTLLLTPV